MSKSSYNKKPKRGKYTVIIINDERNTFEHVTKCLREICGHNKLQAIQCTSIIHHTGKCNVYTDRYDVCTEVYSELLNEGLKVTIIK